MQHDMTVFTHQTELTPDYLQSEARLAFWCLSRQTFDAAVVQEHMPSLTHVIALGLVTGNKWESMQCVQMALNCVSALAKQVPAALQAYSNLWLPLIWKLLLVQPVTEYEQVHAPARILSSSCLTVMQGTHMHTWSHQSAESGIALDSSSC